MGTAGAATLERLHAEALRQPTSKGLLERIVELGRLYPEAQARAVERLVELSRAEAPLAKPAMLVLHSLYRNSGDFEKATATEAALLSRYRDDPTALEYLANLDFARGDSALGRERLSAALRHTTDAAVELRLLRRLRNSLLDARDVASAKDVQARLLEASHRDPAVELEFGRELLARGEHRAAIAILEPMSRSVQATPGLRMAVSRDVLAAALAANDVPLAQRLAERLWAEADHALETDDSLKTLITDVYRRGAGLQALVERLERRPSPLSSRLGWLADLHEELGQLDRSIAYRRRLLLGRPHDTETRLALVRTLQTAGDPEATLREREALVRNCAECIDQALALAVDWQRRGHPESAAAILQRVERSHHVTGDTAVRLADAWEQLGQSQHAQRILERSAPSSPDSRVATLTLNAAVPAAEPSGNDSARVTGPEQDAVAVGSWLQQADAAISQGKLDEAVAFLDRVRQTKALSPRSQARLAMAFERAAASANKDAAALREQAEHLWIELLTAKQLPEAGAADAGAHVVRIWTIRGTLAEQTSRLESNFAQQPNDRNLGLWLAEAEERLGMLDRAARTMAAVYARWPDSSTLPERIAALARRRGDFSQAIATTERQLKHGTHFDSAVLRRLVDLALEAKQDERAVAYAKRWIDVAATDAEAWYLYAKLLRRTVTSGNTEGRTALAHAVELNPNRAALALELADWLAQDGEPEAAFEQLSAVLRKGSEEPVLAEAARRSIPLAASLGRVESLDLMLRQAAARVSSSAALRGPLLELDAQLIQKALRDRLAPDEPTRAAAESLLNRIGQRASATLVESLSDHNPARQRLALDLLMELRPRGLGQQLLTFAASAAPVAMRSQALLLLGRVAEPTLVPQLNAFLQPRTNEQQASPVALAAGFALSRIRSADATATLRKLLRNSSTELRGFAALWLAERGDVSVIPLLTSVRSSATDAAPTRAAAIAAITRLSKPPITVAGDSATSATHIERLMQLALWSADPQHVELSKIAETIAADLPTDVQTYTAIATRLTGAPCADWNEVLSRPKSLDDLEQTLLELHRCRASSEDRLELFVKLAEPLGRALRARINASPEGARAVGRLLLEREPEVGLGTLIPSLAELPKPDQERLGQSMKAHFVPVALAFGALLEHDAPDLRELAIGVRVLMLHDEATLVRGLSDEAQTVRLRALGWAKQCPTDAVLAQIAARLRTDPSYIVRRTAAEVLGALIRPPARGNLLDSLRYAARNDAFSMVRTAALSSLSRTNPLAAAAELSYAESNDSEPAVVGLAHRLREKQP